MKTEGVVTSIENGVATVECEIRSACVSCEFSAVCAEKPKKGTTRATNDAGAKTGDRVEIESDSESVLFYAFFVFVFPVVIAIALYFFFEKAGVPYPAAFSCASGVAVLVLSCVVLEKKAKKNVKSRIVGIITLKNESEIDTSDEKQGMECQKMHRA